MDTSKEYIKMCDCPEIQNRKHPMYAVLMKRTPKLDCIVCVHWKGIRKDRKGYIWLPRQDELQEMIEWSPLDHPHTLIAMFYDFDIEWLKDINRKDSVSMEQLWLACVMDGKHHKKWDGEKWNDLD